MQRTWFKDGRAMRVGSGLSAGGKRARADWFELGSRVVAELVAENYSAVAAERAGWIAARVA